MPRVSVIVPLYNKAAWVARCVASIQAQTLKDFEVVAVDDGSTDGTRAAFEAAVAGDPRFRFHAQPNGGVSRARNVAMQRASADLVAFLDADDEWRPDYLRTVVDAFDRHPDALIVGTGYDIEHELTGLCVRRGLYEPETPIGPKAFFDGWTRIGVCPLFIGATAVRRADLLAIGGFEPGMNLGEDLLAFSRLVDRGPLVYVDASLAIYYLSGSGTLATSPSMTAIREHVKLLRELRRQVDAGHCDVSVYRRWVAIHTGYLIESGQRAELARFLAHTPSQIRPRQWAAALLELTAMRGPVRRLLGRA